MLPDHFPGHSQILPPHFGHPVSGRGFKNTVLALPGGDSSLLAKYWFGKITMEYTF